MYINLYTFAKRENSTSQPSGTGTQYNCYLKEGTSIVSPVIVIDFGDEASPAAHIYNYAYIPDFNRYYFITDVVSTGYLWEYSLQTDILATYKSNIAASTLYLTRCSSQYDGDIVDKYYPLQTSYTSYSVALASPWVRPLVGTVDISTGCFILGIVADPASSSNPAGYGSLQFYAMERDELYNLCHALLTDANIKFNESGISLDLQKAMVDPLSFIKSCIWVPYSYASLSASESATIKIWTWTVTAANKPIIENPPYITDTLAIALTAHPDAATRGAYLNTEPYTRIELSNPPFGVTQIDTTMTYNKSYIIVEWVLDLITGGGTCNLYASTTNTKAYDDPLLGRFKSQLGVQIQLSQVVHDVIGSASGFIGGIAGAVGGVLTGDFGAAFAGASNAIGSAVDAMRPHQSSTGSSGGFSDLHGFVQLYEYFYDTVPEDLTHAGRPLCQNVAINTLSSGSFCLAMNGDVAITGTAGEQAALKAYLEGGFYYE